MKHSNKLRIEYELNLKNKTLVNNTEDYKWGCQRLRCRRLPIDREFVTFKMSVTAVSFKIRENSRIFDIFKIRKNS